MPVAYDTTFQCRTNSVEKNNAANILDGLGTNLSAVFNMMLKQINLTKSVPFAIRMPDMNSERVIAEISATQAMEGNPLSVQDKKDLKAYLESSDKEAFKRKYIKELRKEYE